MVYIISVFFNGCPFDFVSIFLLYFPAVCNRPCNGGRCIKPNMCLCDEGSVRSACLPDDLRDAYNKENEQRLPPSDRFDKLPGSGIVAGEKSDDGDDDGGYGIKGSGNSGGYGIKGSGNSGGYGSKGSGDSGGHETKGSGYGSKGDGDSGGPGSRGGSGVNGGIGSGNGGSGVSTRIATTSTTSIPSAVMASRNVCKYPCLNGGTCQGSVCACRQGYSGENCADRK